MCGFDEPMGGPSLKEETQETKGHEEEAPVELGTAQLHDLEQALNPSDLLSLHLKSRNTNDTNLLDGGKI